MSPINSGASKTNAHDYSRRSVTSHRIIIALTLHLMVYLIMYLIMYLLLYRMLAPCARHLALYLTLCCIQDDRRDLVRVLKGGGLDSNQPAHFTHSTFAVADEQLQYATPLNPLTT